PRELGVLALAREESGRGRIRPRRDREDAVLLLLLRGDRVEKRLAVARERVFENARKDALVAVGARQIAQHEVGAVILLRSAFRGGAVLRGLGTLDFLFLLHV